MCVSVIHHTHFNSLAQLENRHDSNAWGQTPASTGFCAAYYLFRHPAISLHRKSVILEEMKRAQEMTLNWAGVSCIQFFM